MASLADKVKAYVDSADERRARKAARKARFSESLMLTLQTTTKQLIWWFTIHGTIWIYLTYVLAFTDHAQIAETLSSNVCTVVIGSMGMYVISKTIENVFKYNGVGGVSNQKALEREGVADPGAASDIDGIPVIDMTGGIETNGTPETYPDMDPAAPESVVPEPISDPDEVEEPSDVDPSALD